MAKIVTLIVDDSAVVRQALTDILGSDPGIEVMAAVADPIFAMRRMEKRWPDVIILDLQMPRMDGLTFLRKIMSEHPTPVVICSTLTEEGAQATMEVLSSGAVDAITKPKIGLQGFLYETKLTLIDIVKAASKANLKKLQRNAVLAKRPMPSLPRTESRAPEVAKTTSRFARTPVTGELQVAPKLSADAMLAPPTATRGPVTLTETVVAIGASTGGTQALEVILHSLPYNAPGVAIVQHMPAGFTAAFANRLNSICEIEVREAKNNDRLREGLALIAPGNQHLLVRRSGAQYFVEVKDGPVINRHRPSVDVLFRSVAHAAGSNATGVILTGMGDDGARGLLEMHQSGAFTIAQNEETCVVFGMPKEAIKRDAADKILPLEEITQAVLKRKA